MQTFYEPAHDKTYDKTCVTSKGSDQAVHPSSIALRKHAYSNILKISPPKTEMIQIKILIILIFLLKT